MDYQLAVVIAVVAGAALYVLRAFWKSMTRAGCGSGCGKCTTATEEKQTPGRIALEQIRRP
jgi:hypothetical protein